MAIWLSKTENAALCGLSVRQYSDVIQPRLPKVAVKGSGATLRHEAGAVVSVLVAYRLEQAKPADPDGDPLLSGGDSPNLERYRGVKADLATLDLRERNRELVRIGVLQTSMRTALAALRGTGDRLARQFGNDAADIYNEGVTEFEAAALAAVRKFDSDGSDDNRRDAADPAMGGGDADAAAPDA